MSGLFGSALRRGQGSAFRGAFQRKIGDRPPGTFMIAGSVFDRTYFNGYYNLAAGWDSALGSLPDGKIRGYTIGCLYTFVNYEIWGEPSVTSPGAVSLSFGIEGFTIEEVVSSGLSLYIDNFVFPFSEVEADLGYEWGGFAWCDWVGPAVGGKYAGIQMPMLQENAVYRLDIR